MKTISHALVALALVLGLSACAFDVGGSLNKQGVNDHAGAQLGADHETGVGANVAAGIGKDGVTVDGGFGLSVGGQDLIHVGNTGK